MPCPCENNNNEVGSAPIELDVIPIENHTLFQGNLIDFSLYVNEKYIVRIEKIQEREYLIIWCDTTSQ